MTIDNIIYQKSLNFTQILTIDKKKENITNNKELNLNHSFEINLNISKNIISEISSRHKSCIFYFNKRFLALFLVSCINFPPINNIKNHTHKKVY